MVVEHDTVLAIPFVANNFGQTKFLVWPNQVWPCFLGVAGSGGRWSWWGCEGRRASKGEGPKGGPEPRNTRPRRVGPEGRGPKGGRRGGQNFAFFPSPVTIVSLFLPSLGESSRGILVVFEAPGPICARLEFSVSRVKPGGRGSEEGRSGKSLGKGFPVEGGSGGGRKAVLVRWCLGKGGLGEDGERGPGNTEIGPKQLKH